MVSRWVNLTSATLCLLAPAAMAAKSIPLTVRETAGVARSGWPVTNGIPFADGELKIGRDHIRVIGPSGEEVPCQWLPTMQWGNAPAGPNGFARWVLVSFLADVPADGETQYTLEYGPDVPPPAVRPDAAARLAPAETLLLRVGGATVTLHSVVHQLLDRVAFEERGAEIPLVVARTGGGTQVMYRPTAAAIPKRAHAELPARLVVEEAGPVRTVIRADEQLDELWSVVTRYVGYHDWPFLQVQTTLICGAGQPNPEFQELRLDEYSLTLPLTFRDAANVSLGGGNAARADGWQEISFPLGRGQEVALEQDLLHEFRYRNLGPDGLCAGFSYNIRRDGKLMQTGHRAPGWVMVSDGRHGISAHCRYFWQLFPKRLAVQPDELKIELWASGAALKPEPANNYYKGMAKTHTLLFHFFTDKPALSPADIQRAFEAPLFAFPSPAYMCSTGAYGRHPLSPAVRADGQPVHPEWDAAAEQIVNFARKGSTGLLALREANDCYGYKNFGDWLLGGREGYWASHEYDTLWGVLQQFYRTGDLRYLYCAQELAQHEYDMDYRHNLTRDSSRYPQTSHDKGEFHFQGGDSHGQMRLAGSPDPGHVHCSGLVNYYLLTGDPRAEDVLRWAFPIWYAEDKERLVGGGTWRYVGGYLAEIMCRAYEFSWDITYLDRVQYAIERNFVMGPQQRTRHPDGLWWDQDGARYTCQPWMADSVVSGFSYFTNLYPNHPRRKLLEESFVHIADFVDKYAFDRQRKAICQGIWKSGPNATDYAPSGTYYEGYMCGLCSLTMGVAYELTGDPHYLDVGRELVRITAASAPEIWHGKAASQAMLYTPRFLGYADQAL